MESTALNYKTIIDKHGICVIVPTYNNAVTLEDVLTRILNFTSNIIIVNDGSTDSTSDILKKFKDLEQIHIPKNQGKGNALRKGFKKAIELNYEHAITIDSDGQHFPEDLPLFFQKIDESPDALIMGARDMTQEEVPGKSSFGNRFSNFWYYVETGIKLPDTQTGFRSYPLKMIKKMKFFTKKFEFEIEAIVKLAWRGAEVISIPIKVIYDFEERVSHFRPFKDFTRISFLNTYLFTLTLIYYLPLRILRKIRKEGFWNIIKKEWKENSENDFKRSFSLGFGLMMGIFPIWGFQMLVAAAFAVLFRLNKIIVLAASNISIPPMIPLIIYGSYYTGSFFMTNNIEHINWDELTLESININFLQYVVGAVVLSVVVGLLGFVLSYAILKLKRRP
jgi:glycosyltransferase involved in cell wall biosynthesis